MEHTYLCDMCGEIYVSAANYSSLKQKYCCGYPVWYSRKQVGYMRMKTPDVLNADYVNYISDLEKILKNVRENESLD